MCQMSEKQCYVISSKPSSPFQFTLVPPTGKFLLGSGATHGIHCVARKWPKLASCSDSKNTPAKRCGGEQRSGEYHVLRDHLDRQEMEGAEEGSTESNLALLSRVLLQPELH